MYTLLTLKLAERAPIKCVVLTCAHDFDCDWQRVNTFFHRVTLTRILLLQIISYSETKVPFLVIMECKRTCVTSVYELILLLYTSRSREYLQCFHVDCGTEHMLNWDQRIATRTGLEQSSTRTPCRSLIGVVCEF